jgi:hypothetical protein
MLFTSFALPIVYMFLLVGLFISDSFIFIIICNEAVHVCVLRAARFKILPGYRGT